MREQAEYIRTELLQRDFDVFLDTYNINPTDRWRLYIERQIEKTDVFVILFNKTGYEQGGYFATELEHIIRQLEQGKLPIVVVFPPSIQDDLPAGLKSFNCIKADEGKDSWSDVLIREVERLRRKKQLRLASIIAVGLVAICVGGALIKNLEIVFSPDPPPINPIQKINIASVISADGDNDNIGADQAIGIEIAQKYLKDLKQEKKFNIKVEVKIESPNQINDSQQQALGRMRSLITSNKGNVAVIRPTLSNQAVKILEEANEWKTVIMAPSNTQSGLPKQSQYYFRVSSPVERLVKHSVDAAMDEFKKNSNEKPAKIVMLYAYDDTYARSEQDKFLDYVMSSYSSSTEVYSIYPYERKKLLGTLFEKLQKLLEIESPDIIIISGLTSDGSKIIKFLKKTNDYEGLIVGGNGLNSRQLFEECLSACNEVIISQAYVHDSNTDINKKFKELYKEVVKEREDGPWPDTPPQFTAQMFAAADVLLQSLNKISGSPDFANMNLSELRQKLRDELPNESFTTVLGEITFDEHGEITQKDQDFSPSIVKGVDENGKNGRFELIK